MKFTLSLPNKATLFFSLDRFNDLSSMMNSPSTNQHSRYWTEVDYSNSVRSKDQPWTTQREPSHEPNRTLTEKQQVFSSPFLWTYVNKPLWTFLCPKRFTFFSLGGNTVYPLTILIQVKVKDTLQLMVSHSVCLGIEPHLGHITRCVLLFWPVLFCPCGVTSLTRRRVCYLSTIICSSKSSVYTLKAFTYYLLLQDRTGVMYIHYIQSLFQSRLGTADYTLLIVDQATTAV
jgi:hypothetical protein